VYLSLLLSLIVQEIKIKRSAVAIKGEGDLYIPCSLSIARKRRVGWVGHLESLEMSNNKLQPSFHSTSPVIKRNALRVHTGFVLCIASDIRVDARTKIENRASRYGYKALKQRCTK